MNQRPDAPAARRNSEAILEVLREEFSNSRAVLEIGSGTGQHAVHFAAALDGLVWQTSDRSVNHPGIRAWIEHARLANVKQPLDVDVLENVDVGGAYDAVFSANTAHIMSEDAVRRMFELVGRTLPAGGVFCLYGPFNIDGNFTSDSNAAFDRSLRGEDPGMGIRDLDWLDDIANDNALVRVRRYAMPANNMIVVWRKREDD